MVVVDNAFPCLDGIHCALLVAVLRRQFVKPVQALGAAAEPQHLARGEITGVERQLLKEQQHITALQLKAEDYIAFRIDAVNLNDRLCDIEADCRNRLHRLAPPNRGDLNSTHVHGAHAPVEEPSTASIADMAPPSRRRVEVAL